MVNVLQFVRCFFHASPLDTDTFHLCADQIFLFSKPKIIIVIIISKICFVYLCWFFGFERTTFLRLPALKYLFKAIVSDAMLKPVFMNLVCCKNFFTPVFISIPWELVTLMPLRTWSLKVQISDWFVKWNRQINTFQPWQILSLYQHPVLGICPHQPCY